jgi:hypothetical protein
MSVLRTPVPCHLDEPGEVIARFLAVVGLRRSLAGAVQAAIAIGSRSCDFSYSTSASAGRRGKQHVAKELARGQHARGRDGRLLARVLQIGGAAHERQPLVAIALANATHAARHALHLHLGSPICVLAFEAIGDARARRQPPRLRPRPRCARPRSSSQSRSAIG